MNYALYTAGTRDTRALISRHVDYSDALAAWRASQGSDPEGWLIVPEGDADELGALGDLLGINPGYGDGVYVLRCGGGVSCLGFAVCDKRTAGVAQWLESTGYKGKIAPSAPTASPQAFARYVAVMAAGAAHSRATGARCPAELTPQLIGLEGKRVEVTDSDGEKRRFRVGKSTGWSPIHLEIEGRANGGGAAYLAPGATVRVI